MDLRQLPTHDTISGNVDDFFHSTKEMHDQVKKTLIEANQKLKERKDKGRR